VGDGRLIVENLAGRDVTVANRAVTDRIDVDLAKGGVEIVFGYGERILASCPDGKDELQELASRQDVASAVEGVFMALLNPDGSVAIGGPEPDKEYRLAPLEEGADTDAEMDTGPIPEITEEDLEAARRKERRRRRKGFFRRSPGIMLSFLFHLVVILGLYSTIRILEVTSGDGRATEVAVHNPETPTVKDETHEPPTPDASTETDEPTDEVTPTVDESHTEVFPDAGAAQPGAEPDGSGITGVVGVGSGGIGDGGPTGSGRRSGGGSRGGKRSAPVERALAWLAEHQLEDGSWGAGTSLARCRRCTAPGQRDYRVAMTGLALLAFTGGGNSHRDGKYRRRVQDAVRWLAKRQEKDGSFHAAGTPAAEREMYGDAIATLALAELYRVTETSLIKASLTRAIRHIERAQAPYAGWRYQPGAIESDTSVTAWAILALSSAQRGGLEVNPMVWAGARGWLSDVTENRTFRVGYNRRGRGSLGMTAGGLLLMLSMDRKYPVHPVRSATALLRANPPFWPEEGVTPPAGNPPDLNYWLFGTVASRRAGSKTWTIFSRGVRKVLIRNQEGGGHERGSFTPPGRWSRVGGRVYTTATAAVCLAMASELPWSLL